SGSTGRVYVVYGKTSGTAVAASAIVAGSGGFALTGETTSSFAGHAVSSGGDINGDGFADIIVGAPFLNGQAGKAYVLFGKSSMGSLTLSALGGSGFTISGEAANNVLGSDVTYAGDVNGDGLADIAVGAYGYGSNAGRSYVIFGRTSGNIDINVASSSLGTRGFMILSESVADEEGTSISYAGDMNGDGLADILVASRLNDAAGSNVGRVYVVYGRSGTASVVLADVARGIGGFAVTGQCSDDQFGHDVAAGGDINGDGLADIVIGARSNDGSANEAGRAYVIFGRTDGTSSSVVVDVMGTASAEALSDGGTGKTVFAGAGDDTLTLTAASVMDGQ
ncbi:integrin alpha, partial [Aureimonas altamirensis]|uniref:integrin alpha n=1 Tax=Aureimonas altamirensis TaxID=370622 RepID=UPI002036F3C7